MLSKNHGRGILVTLVPDEGKGKDPHITIACWKGLKDIERAIELAGFLKGVSIRAGDIEFERWGPNSTKITKFPLSCGTDLPGIRNEIQAMLKQFGTKPELSYGRKEPIYHISNEWIEWLKEQDPNLKITFELVVRVV